MQETMQIDHRLEKGQVENGGRTNSCSFAGVKPIMADLPWPKIRVKAPNAYYADLLSVDYCGSVSELSAVTQYINNENRLSCERCSLAKTLLGIAMAEMMHLEKLGELIWLLGGKVSYTAKTCNGRQKLWTPEYLTLPEKVERMLLADMEAEQAAINQYRMHIRIIEDTWVDAVLERIIRDEEYHIMLLRTLMKEL